MTAQGRSRSGYSAWRLIAEELRREIVGGVRAPGAKLPSEGELAERFGVHRNTVRQAVAALAAEHLVVSRRGSGTFVAEHTVLVHRIGARTRFSDSLGRRGTASGRLFATQHGRDQLAESWGKLYTPKQGAELPSEELVEVQQGDDFGWPYCYYDPGRKKLVLAPEYGGDGGKEVGRCAEKKPPVAAFPAHWAPNALAIYTRSEFPKAYQGGAFIAFHGSWNRAPSPQGGYNVVFQPLADGKASGKYMVFADGFRSGKDGVEHRPTGLAIGPDGSLYIADDAAGRIWRVTYKG